MNGLSRVIIVLCLTVGQAGSTSSQPPENDSLCGAKCLYVILRTHGIAPETFDAMLSQIGRPGAAGYSLSELSAAGRMYGLNSVCVRLTPDDLRELGTTNVILHLDLGEGHFVLCNQIDPVHGTVALFETNGGMALGVPVNEIPHWSGHAVVFSTEKTRLQTDGTFILAATLTSGLCCLIGLCYFYRQRRVRTVLQCICCISVLSINACNRPKSLDDIRAVLECLDKPIADLGTVERARDPFVVERSIKNGGSIPVDIGGIELTCGCASSGMMPSVLAPGETATLRFYLSRSEIGHHQATATIRSTADYLRFTFRWIVQSDLTTEPSSLYGIRLPPDAVTEIPVQINCSVPVDFSQLTVSCVHSNCNQPILVDAELRGRECVLRFAVPPDAHPFKLNGEINIVGSGTNSLKACIPWTAVLSEEIESSPKEIWITQERQDVKIVAIADKWELWEPISVEWFPRSSAEPYFTVSKKGKNVRVYQFRLDRARLPNGAVLRFLSVDGDVKMEIPVNAN